MPEEDAEPGTATTRPVAPDHIDEEEEESFPASDPPSDWSGPSSDRDPD